ncbi:MAG: translocation/assembly module TamB domain-containing protein [Myxococcales bacterium]|nr:translocation/assembly module TamB domain-containing protein [Myxococcales bacterium]
MADADRSKLQAPPASPQPDAALLADGKKLLEKLCRGFRVRHLYPAGPNLALLLEAWQTLERERTVGRLAPRTRPQRRRLRALVKQLAQRDITVRSLRITYKLPGMRPRPIPGTSPPLVERALERVDPDVRRDIERHLHGASRQTLKQAHAQQHSTFDARFARGLAQLRDALLKECLAHPDEIPTLHPQYIAYCAAGVPVRAQHPVLRLLFVKLPLYLWLGFFGFFSVVYVAAYFFLNDENLGRLLTMVIGRQINGDLEFGSVHWRPTLILDLVTGQPHHATVKDIKIWRGYKKEGQGGERQHVIGYADHVEAKLMLHEIIPWNRIGVVPDVFEVPWVLHFTEAEVVGKLRMDIGEYPIPGPDGTVIWAINLLEAFQFNPALANFVPSTRAISFRCDQIKVHDVDLDLDFRPATGWQTALHLVDGTFSLYFEGLHPKNPPPPKKPLVFDVNAHADTGVLRIVSLGYELPIQDFALKQLAAGGPTPLGDLRIRGEGNFSDSFARLDGWMRDAFNRNNRNVDLRILFEDAGNVARTIGAAHKLPETMLDADGAAVQLHFEGPLQATGIGLAASGLKLDFFRDPADPNPQKDWSLRDVDVSLKMKKTPLPALWGRRFHRPGRDRWNIELARFEGEALGGRVRLRDERASHLILPEAGEPLVMALHTEIEDVDPGQLFAAGPTRERLAGRTEGVLDFEELVLRLGDGSVPDYEPEPDEALAADEPLETRLPTATNHPLASEDVDQSHAEHEHSAMRRLVMDIDSVHLERRRGPADDGLPRDIRADGRVVLDEHDGLDLEDLVITVDGATLGVDGGLDPTLADLRPTALKLKISDGPAFWRALGQRPWFERMTAGLTLSGPVSRPNGTNGSVRLSDVGSGKFALTDIADVRLWMDGGVLSLRSPRIGLLGGVGHLDADIDIFADDPKIRVDADLEGLDLARAAGDYVKGRADIHLDVGDSGGRPVPLSNFQARGVLFVPRLQLGEGEFRDAEANFGVTRDGLDIGRLALHHHRKVSPSYAPDVTIPTGDLRAKGRVSFDNDPALDLDVSAAGLPISAITDILGMKDLPAGAQIGGGTKLDVTGTVARPAVHGQVELKAIHAAGVPLGSGLLTLDSTDLPAADGLAARREIKAVGSFGDEGSRGQHFDWELDAVAAFGPKPRKTAKVPVSADVSVRFENLPLMNALRAANLKAEGLSGQLEGLALNVQSCSPDLPLISSCLWDQQKRDAVQVRVELDRLWAAGSAPRSGVAAGSGDPGDPCRTKESLCSQNRLVASLEGTRLKLRDGWELRSGGRDGGADLTLSGDLELSSEKPEAPAAPADAPPDIKATAAAEPAARKARAHKRCEGPPKGDRTPPATGGHAEVKGEVLLAALAPLIRSLGLGSVTGKVGLDLAIDGHVGDPIIAGSFAVPGQSDALVITAPDRAWTLTVPKLDLRWIHDTLLASGELKIGGQTLQFGQVGGKPTFYTLGGDCGGNFALSAQGALDGRPLQDLVPKILENTSGGLNLRTLHVAGVASSPVDIHTMRATLAPADGGLRFTLVDMGLDPIDVNDGVIDLARCSPSSPCPYNEDGYALYVGGVDHSPGNTPPSEALRARIGDRGRAALWGYVLLAPDFERLPASDLHGRLDEVAYRMFDNSGRPQLYATVATDDIVLEGRDSMTLRGEALVNRARFVRDAQEGVKVLSFADPTTAPAQPPPEIIRDLALDLRVRTTSPFRIDNNVMKGVEGQVLLAVGGSFGDIELSGKIDVTAGVLDVAILNGKYDIQYGKVLLERSLAQSGVDVLALRQDPVYVDRQPRSMYVKLGGTLDAITWRCIVQGDTRTRARTTRECVDYLVLGAGDRSVADANVRRYGGGGLLGRPIGLVGNLTELKLGKYIEKNAPRLSPYTPDIGMRLGQLGIEVNAETPTPWFRSDWGRLTIGAGYTRGYPGNLLRNQYDWRVRFKLLDSATLEFRDNRRSYFNERIIFDPLRQRSLELRFDYQLPSMR